jgi:hypothetical protein
MDQVAAKVITGVKRELEETKEVLKVARTPVSSSPSGMCPSELL